MKIIDFYKKVLSTGGLIADKEGNVSATMKGNTIPFTVEGKRMVLPTREALADPDWSNRMVFHPLSENILKDESKVMAKFRKAINTKLNFVLTGLVGDLLILITSVAEHKDLTPDQAKLLTKCKGADEKTFDAFKSITSKIVLADKDKSFIHMFLKRGAVLDEKKFSRGAIITFPLYNELVKYPELPKEERNVFGVKIRNTDRTVLMSLLEYILPGIEKPGSFSRGSDSDIAPSLDALMRGLLSIAANINQTVDEYSTYLGKGNDYKYNDEWVSVFDNLAQLTPEIRAIPMQAGNEGQPIKQTAPVVPQQSLQVAPAAIGMPPLVAPAVQQYQPQMQQVHTAPPKTSSGGLDFAALVRGNPMMAAATAPMGYPGMQPMMQQGPAALRAGMYQPQQPPMYGNQNAFNQPPMAFNQSRGGFGAI